MKAGKLKNSTLEDRVLTPLPHHPNVLVGPGVGRDCAVVRTSGDVLVVSGDPITGTAKELADLAIHINANDLAASGTRAQYIMCTLLAPPDTSDQAIVDTSAGFEAPPYASFYATLAHPVLMLFLGGFVLADAAAYDFGGAPYDALFSRFGTMFFPDPPAALGHLRQHQRPFAHLQHAPRRRRLRARPRSLPTVPTPAQLMTPSTRPVFSFARATAPLTSSSLATSAYQTYTVRSQVAEALNMAVGAKAPIIDAYNMTGQPAADRPAAGMTPLPTDTQGKFVSQVNVVNGRVDIHLVELLRRQILPGIFLVDPVF